MSYVEKMLGIAGMGTSIAQITLIKRIVSNVVVIVALTAMASTMAGIMLTGGFYALYLTLESHGLQPLAAICTVTGLAFVVVLALAAVAYARWRAIQLLPVNEFPFAGQVGKIADSFIQGLLGERTGERNHEHPHDRL